MGGTIVNFRDLLNESWPTSDIFKWAMPGEDRAWQTMVGETSVQK